MVVRNQAFIRYFEDRNLPVKVEVTDVAKDRGKLPDVQSMLIDARPDLVVTWGTSAVLALWKGHVQIMAQVLQLGIFLRYL